MKSEARFLLGAAAIWIIGAVLGMTMIGCTSPAAPTIVITVESGDGDVDTDITGDTSTQTGPQAQ
jgi:hypothetical protein